MLRNYRQQNARRTVGMSPPLFPIPKGTRLKTKPRRERRLTEPQTSPNRLHIDHWDLHRRHPHGNVLALHPVHRFLKAGQYPASGTGPRRLQFFHGAILFRYPATKRGSRIFIWFCSAFVKLAFSFFANTLSKNSGRDSS